MTLADFGNGLPYICDIQRLAGTPQVPTTVRKRVFLDMRLGLSETKEVGPFGVNFWIAVLHTDVGFKPREGDQLVNVRLARTGEVRWMRLYVKLVEPLSRRDYQLYLSETR